MGAFYVDGTVAASGNGLTKETAFKTIGEGLDAWAVQYHQFYVQGRDAEPQSLYVRALDANGNEIVYSTQHGSSDAVAKIPALETDPVGGYSSIQGYASVPGDLGAPIVIDCQSQLSFGWAAQGYINVDLVRTVVRNAAMVAYHFTNADAIAGYDWNAENCGGGAYAESYSNLCGGSFINAGGVTITSMSYVRIINPPERSIASGPHMNGDAFECIVLGARGTASAISGGDVRNCTVVSADGKGSLGIGGFDGFNNIAVGFKRPIWFTNIAAHNLYTPGTDPPIIGKGFNNVEVPVITLADVAHGDARVMVPSLYKNGVPIGYSGTLPGAGGELCIGQALVNMGARR